MLPKYTVEEKVNLNIIGDCLCDLPNEPLPSEDKSYLAKTRQTIFAAQILTMIEYVSPRPQVEESKYPELD